MQGIVEGLFNYFFTNLFAMTVAMEDIARAALWTNQMGYIKVRAQLLGIYGNVNCPCRRAALSDSNRFNAINTW